MNDDMMKGAWKQLKGKARQKWGQFTDNDLDRLEGKREELSGLLQQKYGYAKERADREVEQFFTENQYDPMTGHTTDSMGHL